jgi:hypothetical protein
MTASETTILDALAYCNGCDMPDDDLDPDSGYCPACMAAALAATMPEPEVG